VEEAGGGRELGDMPEMPSSKGGKEGYKPYPHGAGEEHHSLHLHEGHDHHGFWRDEGLCVTAPLWGTPRTTQTS
jgi:hypothetical protein